MDKFVAWIRYKTTLVTSTSFNVQQSHYRDKTFLKPRHFKTQHSLC